MTQVVTELVIDASGATRNVAEYDRAMEKARLATERVVEVSRKVQQAIDKQAARMAYSARQQVDAFTKVNEVLGNAGRAANDNALLTTVLRDSGKAAEASGAALVRWGRVLGVAGIAAGGAVTAHALLTGSLKDVTDIGAGAAGAVESVVSWLGRLDGSTLAAAGAVGVAGATLLLYQATARDAAAANDDLAKSSGGVSTSAIALAGAAGLAVSAIAAVSKATKDLIELSDRGQDTRLGADLMLALQGGATENRTSLDKLNSAIDTFTGVSKKAEDDAKNFYKALANIDPALVAAFKSAPTQADRLRTVAEGFRLAKDEVQRYQLAQEAFATDNDRVIATFQGGAAALDGYVKRARDFGIVVDEDMIKKAADAQAKLDTLVLLIEQRATIAVVELAQAVIALGKSFGSDFGSTITDATSKLGSFAQVLREAAYARILWDEAQDAKSVGEVGSKLAQIAGIEKLFGFDVQSATDILRKQMFLAGQEAGKTWADSFYDAISGVFGKGPAKVTVNALPAFKPRPSLGGGDAANETDIFTRQVDAINKHIAAMAADADAIGLNAGAHARLRVEAQLTEALLRAGIEINDDYAKQIDEIGKSAEDAATNLARMRVESQIGFDRDTSLLSTEDKQIATQLRAIYGNDIPAALNSAEAAAIRFNSRLTQARDLAVDFTTSFIQGLAQGRSAADSLSDSINGIGSAIASSLAKKGIENAIAGVVSADPAQMAAGAGQLVAAVSVGLFGSPSRERRRDGANDEDASIPRESEKQNERDQRRQAA